MINTEILAENIKKNRKNREISMEDIWYLLGIEETRQEEIEKGEIVPTAKELYGYASIFMIDVKQLMMSEKELQKV